MFTRPSIVSLTVLLFFVSNETLCSAQSCQFKYRQPQIGDHAQQSFDSSLQLKVGIQQAGQAISSSDSTVRRIQQRSMTILQRDAKRVLSARVAYQKSNQSSREGAGPVNDLEHPVVGKTYLVSRPQKELVITYEDGGAPPEEEIALVRPSMESLGKANPIANFFDGRVMRVGETIQLPVHLASELLGFRDNVGAVKRFQLTLTTIENKEGSRRALLATEIDAGEPGKDTMTMRVTGQMALEIDTCRLLDAEFQGPVSIHEQKGPIGAQFTIAGEGNVRVAIHSKCSELKR